MIESIKIFEEASYRGAPEEMKDLRNVNFIYGSNGAGKTTISRIIADESRFPSCSLTWSSGKKLETRVYNSDFIHRNFNQPTDMKGIFTMGEDQVETLAKIETVKGDIKTLNEKAENLTRNLEGEDGAGGKRHELEILELGFKETCWKKKQIHDEAFQGAFTGLRNNSEKFKARILQEIDSNKSALKTHGELLKKAESLFGVAPTTEQVLSVPDFSKLISYESSAILSKKVFGKDDVDIAGLIKKLGNSDWVRQGRPFLENSQGICPFCQQKTEDGFANSLEAYFNEAYLADTKAIDDLVIAYSSESTRLMLQIETIIETSSRYLDVEKLKTEKSFLEAKLTINQQKLDEKKRESSRIVALDSLKDIISGIINLLENANSDIAKHNYLVSNLGKEQTTLTSEIWKFILEDMKTDISSYAIAKNSVIKAIANIEKQLTDLKSERASRVSELNTLEKKTTSILPTITGINGILASFGFQGFKLAQASKGTSYRIERMDSSDAKHTLSEGEKTFLTFLYFYHLLKGSDSETGVNNDRVVVFDDPVSSLDSEVLFIVSNLIKGLFEDVRHGNGNIKQIFILTHNVYFHKEVTFRSDRKKNNVFPHETFWVVRKIDLNSKIENHKVNPIKTSYDLLWEEVRRSDRSNLTIQNTLRRILENYFTILGGIGTEELANHFEGKERIICRSLVSWINDGSHFAHDDLCMTLDDVQVETYLRVFKAVFEKTKQIQHYNMMMGEE